MDAGFFKASTGQKKWVKKRQKSRDAKKPPRADAANCLARPPGGEPIPNHATPLPGRPRFPSFSARFEILERHTRDCAYRQSHRPTRSTHAVAPRETRSRTHNETQTGRMQQGYPPQGYGAPPMNSQQQMYQQQQMYHQQQQLYQQ